MCSGHQHKHNGYCYVVFYYSSFFKHREKDVFFSSSVKDQGNAEVSGHSFSAAGKKALVWLPPGWPLSLGKEARGPW